MPVVNVHEAKTRLSELLRRVAAGEEVVIARAGKPVARLLCIEAPPEPRTPGTAKQLMSIGDDFDDPLPEDLQREFEE